MTIFCYFLPEYFMYSAIIEMVKVKLSLTDIPDTAPPVHLWTVTAPASRSTHSEGGTSLPYIKGRSKKGSKILRTGTNYNVFTERRPAQASNYASSCVITVTRCPTPYAEQTWLQTGDILTRHSILKTLLTIFFKHI